MSGSDVAVGLATMSLLSALATIIGLVLKFATKEDLKDVRQGVESLKIKQEKTDSMVSSLGIQMANMHGDIKVSITSLATQLGQYTLSNSEVKCQLFEGFRKAEEDCKSVESRLKEVEFKQRERK